MAVLEASVVIDRVTSRRGWTSMVASEMAVFTELTVGIISFLASDRESVRGWTMWARRGRSGGRSSPSRGVSGRLA